MVEAAGGALDALERLTAPKTTKEGEEEDEDKVHGVEEAETKRVEEQQQSGEVVELELSESSTPTEEAAALAKLKQQDLEKASIQKLRTKALLRRAKAKTELGGWGDLQCAEDDYKTLSSSMMTTTAANKSTATMSMADQKVVREGLRTLPARIAVVREREMGEMMGKLKELGNGILKPFGLSTADFQMKKDEETGGWSMGMGGQGK